MAARKPAAERSAEIRAAARALALEGGLVAVTLRAVAARVGVAPALVAHYAPAPGMDGLVADAFRSITADELADVRRVAGPDSDPAIDRLARLIRTALDPGRDDVTAVWVDAWSLGRRNPALAAAVRGVADGWQGLVAGIIRDGVASGAFGSTGHGAAAPVDADAVAWLVIGLLDGLNAQSVVHDRHDPAAAGIVLGAVERELGVAAGALGG
ncbi:TetR/AcrR family transcriptional regulator [Agromyces sp. MMS24-K17]|uniref:TetR/AcrR family transcriptional regulator n=1 Tax=Agromyces sp. MMS24-K17 TaxID=3372850 RepID=UPI0037540776